MTIRVRRSAAPTTPMPGADGDTITIQLLKTIVGLGNYLDVLTLTQTPYIDSILSAGWAALYSGPNPPSAYPQAVSVSSAPSDGQVAVYSAATQQWVPTNPSGVSELASASNVTGVVTPVTISTAADIPGCVISVPISSRPVWISGGAHLVPTVTGRGLLQLQLLETTSGLVLVDYDALAFQGEITPAVAALGYVAKIRARIGPTASVRTFKLHCAVFADSGSPAFEVANSNASFPSTPSWIAAEAR